MRKISLKIGSILLVISILICGFSTLASANETKKTKLIVIGDSIAAGTRLFNPDVQCYGAILANTNGWDYENYAVPGHTTYAFSQRLDEDDVKKAVKEADIITVSIGGNNFLLDGLVEMVADALLKDDYTKMDEIIEEFYDSFDECICKIKKLNPNAKLFVQTLYNPMPGAIGEAYAEGQKRLNNAYKNYLKQHKNKYTVVDIEPLFEGHSEYIATDFIHPNKKGHLVIAKAYQETFKKMGLTKTSEIVEPTFIEIISIDIIKKIEDMWFQLTNSLNLMLGGLQG